MSIMAGQFAREKSTGRIVIAYATVGAGKFGQLIATDSFEHWVPAHGFEGITDQEARAAGVDVDRVGWRPNGVADALDALNNFFPPNDPAVEHYSNPGESGLSDLVTDLAGRKNNECVYSWPDGTVVFARLVKRGAA